MNVCIALFVSGSLLQATRMHKKLHLGVDFMFNYLILQLSMRSDGPLLDKSVRMGSNITAPLARRLTELFLDIGFRFGFHSVSIRLAMAIPVIANDFRRRSETGRRRGSIVLLRFWTRHCQSTDKQIKT